MITITKNQLPKCSFLTTHHPIFSGPGQGPGNGLFHGGIDETTKDNTDDVYGDTFRDGTIIKDGQIVGHVDKQGITHWIHEKDKGVRTAQYIVIGTQGTLTEGPSVFVKYGTYVSPISGKAYHAGEYVPISLSRRDSFMHFVLSSCFCNPLMNTRQFGSRIQRENRHIGKEYDCRLGIELRKNFLFIYLFIQHLHQLEF
jgi:hypothetical protein